jgi:hypothetical protein
MPDDRRADSCAMFVVTPEEALARPSSPRQYTQDGKRYAHKPLLVLLALGRLSATGSSSLTWAEAEEPLADLVTAFGPPSRTARTTSTTAWRCVPWTTSCSTVVPSA